MVMPPTLSAVRKVSSRVAAQSLISYALLRLDDAKKLETVAISDEFEARGIWIECLVLGEKNVEIIELRPIQPEWGRPGLRVLDSDDELRNRRRRTVLGVDIVAEFGSGMQHLLAGHREKRCDQRGALDRSDAGGVDEAKIAHVIAKRAVGVGDENLRARRNAAHRGAELAGRIRQLRPIEINLDQPPCDQDEEDD